MAKKASPKRPIGRPVTVGGTEFVGLRLPAALTSQIDEWAKRKDITRSEAVRQLIEAGLAAKRRAK
jgi:metal-responsive CopG/Arc/MetJ family transcriptional regulator